MVEPLNELKDALEKTERVLFEQYIEIAQLKAKLKTLEEKTREVEARTIKNNINRFIETIDVTADTYKAGLERAIEMCNEHVGCDILLLSLAEIICQRNALEIRVRKLTEALQYYAEKSNWVSRTGKTGICSIDIEDREDFGSEYPWAGGKRARSALFEVPQIKRTDCNIRMSGEEANGI